MRVRLVLVLAMVGASSLGCGGAAPMSMPTPLAHIQQPQSPLPGTLVLRSASCQAEGRPVALGRLYLSQSGGQFRVARVEYNDEGQFILERGKGGKGYGYFDQYVNQQKPFNQYTFNTLLGLWKLFGMRFSLDKSIYHCQLD